MLSLLEVLPMVSPIEHEEALAFIENRGLIGKGLGCVHAHLLASAVLTGFSLWTGDKKLQKAAEGLDCDYRRKAG
jgi:predicted nucleic acid-binding protein